MLFFIVENSCQFLANDLFCNNIARLLKNYGTNSLIKA